MTRQFDDMDDVDEYIKLFEQATLSSFVIYSVERSYKDRAWQPSTKSRIYWQWARGAGTPAIEYTGVPFVFIGSKKMICHHGKDLSLMKKQRYREQKAKKLLEGHRFKKRRTLGQDTKKVGCPSSIHVTRIARFPKYALENNTDRARKMTAKALRTALRRDPVVWENIYIITNPSAHVGHTLEGEFIPGWTWQQLTPVDLAPRYTLDAGSLIEQVIVEGEDMAMDDVGEPITCEVSTSPGGQATCEIEVFDAGANTVPRKRAKKMAAWRKCVSLNKQILDNLYDIEDQNTLEDLSVKLTTVLNDMQPMITEAAMQLDTGNKKRRSPVNQQKSLLRNKMGRTKRKFGARGSTYKGPLKLTRAPAPATVTFQTVSSTLEPAAAASFQPNSITLQSASGVPLNTSSFTVQPALNAPLQATTFTFQTAPGASLQTASSPIQSVSSAALQSALLRTLQPAPATPPQRKWRELRPAIPNSSAQSGATSPQSVMKSTIFILQPASATPINPATQPLTLSPLKLAAKSATESSALPATPQSTPFNLPTRLPSSLLPPLSP